MLATLDTGHTAAALTHIADSALKWVPFDYNAKLAKLLTDYDEMDRLLNTVRMVAFSQPHVALRIDHSTLPPPHGFTNFLDKPDAPVVGWSNGTNGLFEFWVIRSAVDLGTAPVMTKVKDGVFLHWNALVGFSPDDLNGKTFDLVTPARATQLGTEIAQSGSATRYTVADLLGSYPYAYVYFGNPGTATSGNVNGFPFVLTRTGSMAGTGGLELVRQ